MDFWIFGFLEHPVCYTWKTHTMAELVSKLEPGFGHIEIQWQPTWMWMCTRLISIVVDLGIQALLAILKSSAAMNETLNEV